MSFWTLLIGIVVGVGGAMALIRRARVSGVAPGVSPHLLPDPALEWLRRAHGAAGVWVAEMSSSDGEPHAERVVDAERLSVAQIVAVDRRLERARDQEQSGAERMEGGTLVFHATPAAADRAARAGQHPGSISRVGGERRAQARLSARAYAGRPGRRGRVRA
jgi:uncharacterized membrane protein